MRHFNIWILYYVQRITEVHNSVVITDRMWARLLSSTNQPSFLGPKELAEAETQEEPPTQMLDGENSRDNESSSTGNSKS